ncbi:MAG: iron-sulfur binding hydrogenase [Spirochaetales bacterium]|nr:iron-sulfur binding hydrogenase [Spirochaetales bacterium]
MNENDFTKQLGYTLIGEGDGGGITAAYTSDLLSDVMGNAPGDSVLITIQAHKNTVAVADLTGVKAIILCNDRSPDQGMIDAAKEAGIGLYVSSDDQFTVSCAVGKLLAS